MDTSTTMLMFLASFFLPEGILDWFDIVKVNEETERPKKDQIYQAKLHIYLDERDNRTNEYLFLKPNGFTEPTVVNDFPVRDRKLVLHIRRRRWKDEHGKSIILNNYPIVAEGTRFSPELAAFLKGETGYDPRDGEVLGAILSD